MTPAGSVLLLGDSHLLDRSADGITTLGPRLRARGWDVTTRAVGGLETRGALAGWEDPPFSDAVVLSFGTNDCSPWCEVPLQEFARNLDQILRRLPGRLLLVLGPTPGGEMWGHTPELLRGYSDVAASVAAARGAVFVSLLELLSAEHLLADSVHLGNEAYRLLADAVDSKLSAAQGRLRA